MPHNRIGDEQSNEMSFSWSAAHPTTRFELLLDSEEEVQLKIHPTTLSKMARRTGR
jgi:hypothetical protein